MTLAKIRMKIGISEFEGEGDQDWLAEQLASVLQVVREFDIVPRPSIEEASNASSRSGDDSGATGNGTLAAFLRSTNASESQTKRFLCTAAWLMQGGKTRLSTGDVTKALSDNHQTKLNNASQALNDNAKKGHCQKEGRQFYVTPEGFEALKTAKA